MTNYLLINGKEYKTEKIWRKDKHSKERDSKGERYPYPKEGDEWTGRHIFISRLREIETDLESKNKFKKTSPKDCLLCDKKQITNKTYLYNNMMWENGLVHYIERHLINPSTLFKDIVYSYELLAKKRTVNRIKLTGQIYRQFVKIDRRQLNILDALMIHGGYRKKYGDIESTDVRYSEHSGLLDFDGQVLTKIVVSGNISRVDDDDDDIYLPIDLDEMKDYEYIFHTHPPTPKPGGRAGDGILYDFPSIGDIFHFIDNHNDGNVVGSIVVTPEGLYCIRKLNDDPKNIKIDDERFYRAYMKEWERVQSESLDIYGTDFTTKYFFKVIAQDTKWIERLNRTLNNFDIHIDFFPRKQDANKDWVLDTIYLPFRKNKK